VRVDADRHAEACRGTRRGRMLLEKDNAKNNDCMERCPEVSIRVGRYREELKGTEKRR
jgi:hypothetical protein